MTRRLLIAALFLSIAATAAAPAPKLGDSRPSRPKRRLASSATNR